MEDMDLKDFYKELEDDETERNQHPCCYNCRNCYFEYGDYLCKKNDYPLDDMDIQKCEDWK